MAGPGAFKSRLQRKPARRVSQKRISQSSRSRSTEALQFCWDRREMVGSIIFSLVVLAGILEEREAWNVDYPHRRPPQLGR